MAPARLIDRLHPRALRFAWQRLRLAHAGIKVSTDGPLTRLGGWCVDLTMLGRNSVIYSFGVGTDVEWELELIARVGAEIHAFDPTPMSRAWIERQRLPREFRFYPLGISNREGELLLHPPRRPDDPHFSQDRMSGTKVSAGSVACPVSTLGAIARNLGHRRIDILKLDVEGSEFDCVPDLLASGVEIGQLLVEVHYRNPGRTIDDGIGLLRSILAAGFICTSMSERALEFSFIHPAAKMRAPRRNAGEAVTPRP
jgi:FkbM family methyltransferase